MSYIRILNSTMEIQGELDDYESMFFIRRWHGIGEIELRINRFKNHTDKLIKNNILMIGKSLNKSFIIKHREIEFTEEGRATENWLIKGFSLKAIIAQRLTLPPSHTAYDNKSGNIESVIKHYVNNNAFNPADVKRKILQLVIATDQGRGLNISWQSRFKNLAEEVAELSLASGLGWDVTLDLIQKKFIFDVNEGRNLTVDQNILPPVIFSPQFESLQTLKYTDSELNYKNFAYVAGQGEGIERRVVQLGSDEGINRHEIFIDARDIPETIEEEGQEPIPRPVDDIIKDLTDRGNQQLEQFLQEQYLEGQIITPIERTTTESQEVFLSPTYPADNQFRKTEVISSFMYEKDYDLGDVVTLQNKEWGVTMNARITEIKEIYETSGHKIEAVFGNNRPTLIQKIKQELSQISGEVRK